MESTHITVRHHCASGHYIFHPGCVDCMRFKLARLGLQTIQATQARLDWETQQSQKEVAG